MKNKKLLGFLAFAPLLMFFLSIVILLGEALVVCDTAYIVDSAVGLISACIIVRYGVLILFIILACKNPEFTDKKKLFWAVMLWIFGMLVYPIFWFKYIRKYKEEDVASRNNLETGAAHYTSANAGKNCFYSRNGVSGNATYSYQENVERHYEVPSYPQNMGVYNEVQDNTAFYSRPIGTTQRKSHKTEKQKKKERKKLTQLAFISAGLFVLAIILFIIILATDSNSAIFGFVASVWLFELLLCAIFQFIAFFDYSLHACDNEQLELGTKILWIIFFLVFSSLACPIYWKIYIRTRDCLIN